MKTRAELELAHALLSGALELGFFTCHDDQFRARGALNAICYALGHEECGTLSIVLDAIKTAVTIEEIELLFEQQPKVLQ